MGSKLVKKVCVYSNALKKLLEKRKEGININLLNRVNIEGVFYIKDPDENNKTEN